MDICPSSVTDRQARTAHTDSLDEYLGSYAFEISSNPHPMPCFRTKPVDYLRRYLFPPGQQRLTASVVETVLH